LEFEGNQKVTYFYSLNIANMSNMSCLKQNLPVAI